MILPELELLMAILDFVKSKGKVSVLEEKSNANGS
jgi:hypothetical protein